MTAGTKTPAKRRPERAPSTTTQISRALRALQRGKRTGTGLTRLGILHPAGTVHKLRSMGYVIKTHRQSGVGVDGFWHERLAVYRLVYCPPM